MDGLSRVLDDFRCFNVKNKEKIGTSEKRVPSSPPSAVKDHRASTLSCIWVTSDDECDIVRILFMKQSRQQPMRPMPDLIP